MTISGEPHDDRANGSNAVRPAVPEDAPAIAAVHVRSWQAAYRGLIPDAVLNSLSVERRTAFWADAISDLQPPTGVWVAERDGAVAGFVHVRRSKDQGADPSVGEVGAIYLMPEAWSRGLGRALLDTAVVGLGRNGFEAATLWVFRDNARARRFYDRARWAPDGETKSIEIGGVSLVEVRYRIDLQRDGSGVPQ